MQIYLHKTSGEEGKHASKCRENALKDPGKVLKSSLFVCLFLEIEAGNCVLGQEGNIKLMIFCVFNCM